MTEIMHASILGPVLIRELLEVQIDPLRLQMVADFIAEDQCFAVLRFVLPGFSRIAGPLTLHDLFRIPNARPDACGSSRFRWRFFYS